MPFSTKILVSILVAFGIQAAWVQKSQAALPSNDNQIVANLSVNRPIKTRPAVPADENNATNETDNSQINEVNALISKGKTLGDQRYFGYAEDALDKIQNQSEFNWITTKIYLLQQRHAFSDAHLLLGSLIARYPQEKSLYFTDSTLLVMLGYFPEAERACNKALGVIDLITFSACLTQASLKQTDLQKREKSLANMLSQKDEKYFLWERAVLADAQIRLGNVTEAEKNYLIVLNHTATDHASRIALADLYLSQRRWQDAYNLLFSYANQDSALLRLAVTSRHLQPGNNQWEISVEQRFSEQNSSASNDQLFYLINWHPNSERIATLANTLTNSSKSSLDLALVSSTISVFGKNKKESAIFQWLQTSGYYDARMLF